MTLPKTIPTWPGGQNIVRYFDPPQWQSFICVSYLLDKIHHCIKIISMISWVVIMLSSWHFQKLSQLDPGVKISYDILTPLKLSMTKFFICVSYLLDKICHYIKIILMISLVVIMLLFWHYQNLAQLDQGVKISYDNLTPF